MRKSACRQSETDRPDRASDGRSEEAWVFHDGEEPMSTASTSAALEPTAVVAGNGTSAASAPPMTIPDDMLYEVVDGKIVEKIVGVYETDIATMLIGFLVPFVRAASAWQDPWRDDLLHRSIPEPPATTGRRFRVSRSLARATPSAQGRRLGHGPRPGCRSRQPIQLGRAGPGKDRTSTSGPASPWSGLSIPNSSEVYVYTSPAQILVLQLGQELDGGDLIPGFRLPLATLFEDEAE